MKTILYIGVLGGIGSILRYGISAMLTPYSGNFPWALLLVNGLGSFLIGLVAPCSLLSPWTKDIIIIGLLGGLTTFSSFSLYEILTYYKEGLTAKLLAHFSLLCLLPLALTFLGYFLGKEI